MERQSRMSQVLGIKGFWLYELLDKQTCSKNKVLIILTFVLIPVIVFSIPLILRFSNILTYSVWRIISLFAAASWSFLGPYLIYQYHIQYIEFYEAMSFLETLSIKEIFYHTYCGFQRRVWIASCLWGSLALIILIFPDTLKGYSFYGYNDFWYWVFLLYILFSLHLTACGFAGVVTSFLLLKKLVNSNLMTELLQRKPRKLKAFGKFSFSTVLYFLSGIVFIPILIDFIRENWRYPQVLTIIGILAFILATCVAFFYPLRLVRQCADKSRESLLDKLEAEYVNHLYLKKHSRWRFFQNLQQIDRYNSLCFIQSIKIELLDSSKMLSFFATLVVPILIAISERIIPSDMSIASIFNSLFSR